MARGVKKIPRPDWAPPKHPSIPSIVPSQDLSSWLNAHGFGGCKEQLEENGVETLDGLKMIQNESEIKEFCGELGLDSNIIDSFIKAVISLVGP